MINILEHAVLKQKYGLYKILADITLNTEKRGFQLWNRVLFVVVDNCIVNEDYHQL